MPSIKGKLGMAAVAAAALTCLVATSAVAADAPVCRDYQAKNRIMRIGQHPFAHKAPIKDVAQLQSMWVAQGDEIKALLEGQGLGQVAAPLAEAVAAGKVRDTSMAPGQTFSWMANRKRSKMPANLLMPACYAGKKTYPAYGVTAEIPQPAPALKASCKLDAMGNVEAKTLKADASAASATATVVMKAPGGEKTIITPGGPRTWEGPWAKRYCFDTDFLVSAPPPKGERKIDVYDFMVPAACGNISFVGQTIRTEEVIGEGCTATVTVPRAKAPAPAISLAVEPTEIFRGQSVNYTATGHWDREAECGVVDPLVVTATRCDDTEGGGRWTSETSTYTPTKAGSYTLTGVAKNEIGESAETTATVLVKPRWAIRGFLAAIQSRSNSAWYTGTGPTGRAEDSSLRFDDGWGLGAAAEYRFSDLLGLEGALLYGNVDAKLDWARFGASDADTDKVNISAFTFGPNFHFLKGGNADLYAGVFGAYMQLGDPTFSVAGESRKRTLGSELGYGAQLGLDYGFGPCSPWALHFGARYIDPEFEVKGDGKAKITVSPLFLEAGFAYRF